MNKRTFSKLIIAGGGMLIGAVVGIPAALSAFIPSVRRKKADHWQPVGPIDDFPIGVMTKAVVPIPRDDWAISLREKGVFVYREAGDQVTVFSRNCTDLSCPIAWDPGSEWFFCPCHGGIFAKDGTPKAGPPKEPLYRYATRIRNRLLEVDLSSVPPMI
jgi:menaquinol-cytochrome c reductase iron-sulfur subunit